MCSCIIPQYEVSWDPEISPTSGYDCRLYFSVMQNHESMHFLLAVIIDYYRVSWLGAEISDLVELANVSKSNLKHHFRKTPDILFYANVIYTFESGVVSHRPRSDWPWR